MALLLYWEAAGEILESENPIGILVNQKRQVAYFDSFPNQADRILRLPDDVRDIRDKGGEPRFLLLL